MDTAHSLSILSSVFPAISKDVLLEILIACEGSLENTKSLLSEQFLPEEEQEKNKKGEIGIKAAKAIVKPGSDSKKRLFKESSLANESDNKCSISIQTSLSSFIPLKKPKLQKNRTITLHNAIEIHEHLPTVRLIPNFLPEELANQMLESLVSKRLLFQTKEFYIAGNLCRSSHKSCLFSQDSSSKLQSTYSANKLNTQSYFPELYTTKCWVESEVNKVLSSIPEEKKHPYQIQGKWEANISVINYFANNKEHLDWHTDKLTNIGPLPTIASLTFGATRIFRLRPITPSDSVIYNIPLPHNALLIMLPSTQEQYKHCVPSTSDSLVHRHHISGESRFNITFRMLHPLIAKSKPECDKCGKNMLLRRLFKEEDKNRGFYVWVCFGSYQGADCDGFKYACFDQINESQHRTNEIKLYTNDRNRAAQWLEDANLKQT